VKLGLASSSLVIHPLPNGNKIFENLIIGGIASLGQGWKHPQRQTWQFVARKSPPIQADLPSSS
jgi:hypothetical protein